MAEVKLRIFCCAEGCWRPIFPTFKIQICCKHLKEYREIQKELIQSLKNRTSIRKLLDGRKLIGLWIVLILAGCRECPTNAPCDLAADCPENAICIVNNTDAKIWATSKKPGNIRVIIIHGSTTTVSVLAEKK